MSRKRPDELVTWSVWLRDELAKKARAEGEPEKTPRLTYDDKVDGDVLLLALQADERDRFVEITVARRKKGHAHLAVMATTQAGIDAASEAIGHAHHEISRFANAKRKFVHRIVRLVSVLAGSWAERSGASQRVTAFGEAMTRLQQVLPEAVPMVGVGFHVDLAGADDHHTKETYPTLSGAAVPVAQTWRGLAWDQRNGRWLARAGTLNALLRGKNGADLERAGISLGDIAIAGAAVVGAAAVASTLIGGGNELDDEVQRKHGDSCWADALDPCDIVDCAFSAGDLGNCVPDCDLGGLDCGGLDCSL